jgi:hypothetical protein
MQEVKLAISYFFLSSLFSFLSSGFIEEVLYYFIGNVYGGAVPEDAGVFLEVEHHAVTFAFGDVTYFTVYLFHKTFGLGKFLFLFFKFGGFYGVIFPQEIRLFVNIAFQP